LRERECSPRPRRPLRARECVSMCVCERVKARERVRRGLRGERESLPSGRRGVVRTRQAPPPSDAVVVNVARLPGFQFGA